MGWVFVYFETAAIPMHPTNVAPTPTEAGSEADSSDVEGKGS